MRKAENFAGRRFGRLLATEYIPDNTTGKKRSKWRCICDCGKEILVSSGNLRTGNTKSCGCFRVETTVQRSTTHGLRHTPEYPIWHDMLRRCTDPSTQAFKYYGERGLTVCERWAMFENFYADMGPRPTAKHSIDRIENSKGYSKENCRWATKHQQDRNKTNNHMIDYLGERLCVTDWARKLGLSQPSISHCILNKGMTMEETVQYLKLNLKPKRHL